MAFGLTASSVYVINDLIDKEHDQLHAQKKFRPIASGELAAGPAHALWIALLASSVSLSLWALNWHFLLTLIFYFLLTLIYSFHLKKIAILDVLILSTFYCLRIIAGGAAVTIALSFWLLAFSMFFFLSLAMMKRYIEINASQNSCEDGLLQGRGYRVRDAHLIQSFGTAAGYISVLVLALYIQDPHSLSHYVEPRFIWFACPILLFWISRCWFKAARGEVHEDPIVFALRDWPSLLMGLLMMLIFALARFWNQL